jgi:hypothetical protein
MAFTTGTNFTVRAGFTTRLDFHASVQGALSATLAGVSGAFAGLSTASNASQGALSATLSSITGSFVAANAPRATLAATLAGITGAFTGLNVANTGVLAATLGAMTGAFAAHYDPNVHRFTVSGWRSRQNAANTLSICNPLARKQAVYAPMSANALQEAAQPACASLHALLDATAPIRISTLAANEQAAPIGFQARADLQQMTPIDLERAARIEAATRRDSVSKAVLYQLELIWTETRHTVDDTGRTVHGFLQRSYGEPPLEYRYTPGTAFVFPSPANYTPATSFVWPYTLPVLELVDTQQIGGIRHDTYSHFQRGTRLKLHRCETVEDARRPPPGTSVWIDNPRPPPVIPPEHVTLIIPDQPSYLMNHALSVTLLNLTPVPMTNVRLSYDADAFAWQFSGQLADKGALSLVQQAPNQPPVQLIVTINGYIWKVLVERIEHSRQFAQRSITLSGRGLTALLGQPYEQPASATQGSDLTVQQLADLLLPTGWTNNWIAPTWLVPGGAYSYSGQTPIQALAALASDIGAMLVPARASQAINILPRYPVLPWNYALVSPDLVIPESAIDGLTERTVTPSQANGVYVHGGEIGGVLAWCRLNSTDGARLATTVSNPLLTDVIGCRALGERILAGQYQQPAIQSLTMPMDGVLFPLAAVGQLAQITLDGSPIRSIINSVQVEATLGRVRQTIQIGEETANTWALFKELLPRDPLLVGTLASTDGATALMTLIDGGLVRVRGTGTVGNKYYLRAGKIDGEAPNMAQNEVVI